MMVKRLQLTRFFTGDVSLLAFSGLATQVVNLAAYPLLTQSYSPSSFGVFSVITALANFLGAAILLRFDTIIQIVDPDDEDAILSAALVAGFGLALAVMALLLMFGEWLLALVAENENWRAGYALVIPVLALMNGFFALSRQYYAKNRRYRRFSLANFLRTLTMVAAQLSLVTLLPGPAGLIAGFAVGLGLALVLAWPVSAALLSLIAAAPCRALHSACAVIRCHRTYIQVDVVNVLIASSVLGFYPIIILIGFGAEEAGIFAIASRLVFIPVQVLAGSISTVYFQRLSFAVRQGGVPLRLFYTTIAIATAAAVIISLSVVLFAELFVHFFFPSEWGGVSVIMLFLLPTFIARFVIGSIGSTPLALSRPLILLGWNLAQIVIIGLAWLLTADQGLKAFLMSSGSGLMAAGLMYLGILWVSMRQHTG